MKILAISDEESKYLWDFYERGKLDGIDLIISCGDLDPHYLSFLVTMSSVPVLYVKGNHDNKYDRQPPEGCTCIEDSIFVYNGVRILGLGGSMRYKGGPNQYTEEQMKRRVRKLFWQILRHRGFDILVTHAPAYQVNDGEDLPHRGFRIFCDLMEKYKPKFFLHGHVHKSYGKCYKQYDKYGDTHVINACGKCVFDFEAEDVQSNLVG